MAETNGVFNFEYDENSVIWTINPKIYPLDVVYQAAFVFIDKSYMTLDKNAEGHIMVKLKGKEPLERAGLEVLQGEFANELLSQAVRRKLAKDNKRIRELIVAKALFSAGRPDELNEVMSNLEQPGGSEVPRPWDEATQEEQDELDKLLAEIEEDFEEDPMDIATPWDEKYEEDGKEKKKD